MLYLCHNKNNKGDDDSRRYLPNRTRLCLFTELMFNKEVITEEENDLCKERNV